MFLRLFPLLAYLASTACLVSWLIQQLRALFWAVRAWWLGRRAAVKVLSLKPWSHSDNPHSLFLSLAGVLCGGLVTFWLSQVFLREWLLVILVVLAVLSEEFRVPSHGTRMLEVMAVFDGLLAHQNKSQSLLETLAKVIPDLPAGEVQNRIQETVLRQRSSQDVTRSIQALRGLDPLLDEFVLTLRFTGWQNGPVLSLVLKGLLERASRRWERASRTLWLKDRCRPYLQFLRGAVLSGIWIGLFISSTAVTNVLPARNLVAGLGLAFLVLSGLFSFLLSSRWLRRFLVVSIFILSFVSYAGSLVIPMPSWIQVETISHTSEMALPTSTPASPEGVGPCCHLSP